MAESTSTNGKVSPLNHANCNLPIESDENESEANHKENNLGHASNDAEAEKQGDNTSENREENRDHPNDDKAQEKSVSFYDVPEKKLEEMPKGELNKTEAGKKWLANKNSMVKRNSIILEKEHVIEMLEVFFERRPSRQEIAKKMVQVQFSFPLKKKRGYSV
jgi:hypothetical protein